MSTNERVNHIRIEADEYKSAVKPWVLRLRHLLEDDFSSQLDRMGLKATGKNSPLEKLCLPKEARDTRFRVEALLHREAIAEGTPERGFICVIRELSYTLLNRLLGLKAMEARGLLFLPPPGEPKAEQERTEVITTLPGQVYSRYIRDLRASRGNHYKYESAAEEALLRDALTEAFRYITREIGVLFDPDHEYACVWPTHATLSKIIDMINKDMPESAYRAPDFLGWVYQFFNREEKRRIREDSGGVPRSSYELAAINQFYTPSWVVKVLVDNTLGRLWIRMHPDSSIAPKQPPPLPGTQPGSNSVVDYLIPRTGEKLHYKCLDEAGVVRSFKLARNITLLDPACGTMHFGQYAFGIFYSMYMDEIEHAGDPGWPESPSVEHPRDIPAAILENNLFGIDIDPRAVQIASLSLFLTAKEIAIKNGFSSLDVHIQRTNLVVANAVDLGEEELERLVDIVIHRQGLGDGEERKLSKELFSTLWDNLSFVGELGSLVQVRESTEKVIKRWVWGQAKDKGLVHLDFDMISEKGQLFMHTIREEVDQQQMLVLYEEAQRLRATADKLQLELLITLEEAAADNEGEPEQRLFAEDSARGLQLLRLLSRSYDVVVMNPPYGSFVPEVKDFIKAAYPDTSNDIYSAFIERATQLIELEGYVGALVSRTFLNLKSFEKLRTGILLKRNPLVTMLDLGFGILDDATVETAAIVLSGRRL